MHRSMGKSDFTFRRRAPVDEGSLSNLSSASRFDKAVVRALRAATVPTCSVAGDGALPGDASCCPRTCKQLGRTACGTHIDGCGGVIDCGPCDSHARPDGGLPRCETAPKCVPRSCNSFHGLCGTVPDGCGGTIKCKACSGEACVPTTCEITTFECGLLPDGCGGVLQCNSCKGTTVCRDHKCVPCDPIAPETP
jgi:hypothetical protein